MLTPETNNTEETGENNEENQFKRNPTWEANHVLILEAKEWFVFMKERWPTTAEIIAKTGLSRATVYKHIAEMDDDEFMIEEPKELKFMTSKIMAKLCEGALNGNVKAIRLVFEVTGVLKKGRGIVNPKLQNPKTEIG